MVTDGLVGLIRGLKDLGVAQSDPRLEILKIAVGQYLCQYAILGNKAVFNNALQRAKIWKQSDIFYATISTFKADVQSLNVNCIYLSFF